MYCTVTDMQNLLPEKISIGDQNIGTPIPGRPGPQRSSLTPNQAREFIGYAQQHIDGRLRPFYVCPLRRAKSFETSILANVNRGTGVNIVVYDSGPFIYKGSVRVQDNQNMEIAEVLEVVNDTTIKVSSLQYSYSSHDSLVSVLEYPDPVPIITARFAVSFYIDKLFVSEQSPDVSTYGTNQRNMANGQLGDILSGQVLLFGQDRTGRRFVRGELFDSYSSPSEKVDKSEDKE